MPLKRKMIVYITVIVLCLIVIIFAVRWRDKLIQILVPFFIAMILAYLISPLVHWLEKKKIPKMYAILLIYAVGTTALVMLIIFMLPELISNTRELINTIPQITSQYQNMFDGFMSFIKTRNWPTDLKNTLTREIQQGTVVAQDFIMNSLRKSMSTLIETITMFLDFALSMVIAYYYIKDADFFKNAVLSLTPRRWRNGIIRTGREIHGVLSNFIQGQMITALIVGTMEIIALSIVKVKYPLILGVIGGIANVIPYFGPLIGAIPAVAVALIQSPAKALWVAVAFAIVQQIDNAFISPKIIEGKLGLHPVSTIVAVLIGGEFFGIVGMLVAVPVMAILKIVVKNLVEAIV